MDKSVLYVALLVVSLILSAFFSSTEAAFLSLRKVRIRRMVSDNIPGADRVQRMVEQPEKILPTILLGNNLVNTAFAAVATVIMVAAIGEGSGVLIATIGSTLVLLILGETLPKTLAIKHAETMFLFSSRILEWVDILIMPVAISLQWLSRKISRRDGVDPMVLFTEEEIKTAILMGQEAGAVEDEEAELLNKVFQFGDRELKEVMTPRSGIVWVEHGTALDAFLDTYQEHTNTRFPVFQEQIDNVTGILSIKDIFAAMARGDFSADAVITTQLRQAYFVPDTKPIGVLFRDMQQQGMQIAMAVDEFGGIAGLVTLKQLMEEIVGPVGEEGSQPEAEYEVIDENTFHIDGGMQIDEINDELGIDIPQGEYETVAGFILDTMGNIPVEGEYFWYKDLRINVDEMRGVKIERVIITRAKLGSL